MKISKNDARKKRKQRVRNPIFGSQDRPRLVVFRSNKYIYAQVIDDEQQKTLASSSSLSLQGQKLQLNTDAARKVGEEVAEKAKQYNIEKVKFDRNGYDFHGRVKALADGAREKGLNF